MGTSSGAMMTNVLIGAYPDVFAAGSAWAGVAFGCFADPAGGVDVWNSACAAGTIIKTGPQWAAIVDAAFPGHTGYRPKMQVFHGTADTTLNPQNLQEEIKEWTTVLGLPSSPVQTLNDSPDIGWTTYIYGSTFTATSAANVTHNIQTNETSVLTWFDLTCSGSNCFSRTNLNPNPNPSSSSPSSPSPKTSTPSIKSSTSSIFATTSTTSSSTTKKSIWTTSTATGTGTIPQYGQCGGQAGVFTGSTSCVSPYVCTCFNPYYSQCL